VRRGQGSLRACKGGGNPYAPFCRDRKERRRASRLSRNSQGRVAGGWWAMEGLNAGEEACGESSDGNDDE